MVSSFSRGRFAQKIYFLDTGTGCLNFKKTEKSQVLNGSWTGKCEINPTNFKRKINGPPPCSKLSLSFRVCPVQQHFSSFSHFLDFNQPYSQSTKQSQSILHRLLNHHNYLLLYSNRLFQLQKWNLHRFML